MAVFGFAAAAATASVTASPAAATPGDPSAVSPYVDCVSAAPGPTPDAFTVVFGYRNTSAAAVTIPAGDPANTFTLGPDRGQPTTFAPGDHHGAFATTFAGAATDLAWTLGSTTAALTPTAPSCDTATTVTLAVPAQAATDDSVDVTASVGRMLLAAPTDGSVELSVDSSVIATVPLDGTGVAQTQLDPLEAGTHQVTARYVPVTATPQLLASSATSSITVADAGTLSIASAGFSADGLTARLTVTRTVASGPARVDYATADGSAKSGRDYAASRGTVRFADGQSAATISIPLLRRPLGSPQANFFVLLQRASAPVGTAGATVVLPQVTVVTASPGGSVPGPLDPLTLPGGGGSGPVSGVATVPGVAAATGGSTNVFLMVGGLLIVLGAGAGIFGLTRINASRNGFEV